MARVDRCLGESAECLVIEVTRHDLNRLKAVAKALGWSPKKRQAALNSVFAFGLQAAEESLEEKRYSAGGRRSG
jgi:hypothetical protein